MKQSPPMWTAPSSMRIAMLGTHDVPASYSGTDAEERLFLELLGEAR